MTSVSYKIDWITSTNKGIWMNYQEAVEKLQIKLGEREWLHADRVPSPYREGFESDAGVICWNEDYPEFGVMFRASGVNMARLRASGVSDTDVLKALLGLGWGITRLDLAMDLSETGGRPSELYKLHKEGKISTVAKDVTVYQKSEKKGKVSGETVYFGSRKTKGGRLLRIYDKAAELGLEADLIRVELELKDKWGQKAAQALVQGENIKRVLSDNLFSIVPHGLPDWVKGGASGKFKVVTIEADTQTNFERWFTKIVLPAIEKAVMGEVDGAEGLIERAVLSGKARKRGQLRSMRYKE